MAANVNYPLGARAASSEERHIERQIEREREPSEEAWAFAIAEALVVGVPRLPSVELEAPHAPAAALAEGAMEEAPTTGSPTPSGARGSGARGSGDGAPTESSGLPARLTTELSDPRLGRLELTVARGAQGLAIVINVADTHVKALIEAERATLMQSLKDCGLSVASVRVGRSAGAGIGLAPDREGADRARGNSGLQKPPHRWRAYQGSTDQEEDADPERVDFTA